MDKATLINYFKLSLNNFNTIQFLLVQNYYTQVSFTILKFSDKHS
jgi:hypothetical protein